MKNTLVYLLFVCTIHFACTKCPAPYPGEHGPCTETCGLSSHCSSGLWCCTTPCGGTVCKIPDTPKQTTVHHHQPPAHTPTIQKQTTLHHHQPPAHTPTIQKQTTVHHHQPPAQNTIPQITIPQIPHIPTKHEAQQQFSLYQELFPELQPGFLEQVPLFQEPKQQNIQTDFSHQTNIYQDQIVNLKTDMFPDHYHEQHFLQDTQPPLFTEPQFL
ncbi:unnamed protein product [Mytilus coruscus]|uniref:Uncharacterized protein n=1 Tax=Mytilus coruscus TaxID=42192 RepID=A0A6J8BSP7_MYTCO|nr:unnamed protein product [Mytilus coruscus]